MKYLKLILSLALVISVFISCLSFGGVQGAWHYAMSVSGEINIPIKVEVFPWEGADQLPGDVAGENHQKLVEAIIDGTYTNSDGTVTNIGLNNPDSYISQEIANRSEGNFLFRSDILGSMDYWERNDIAKFFDTETSGLEFVLHFPNGEEEPYYLYTTSAELGESNPNFPIDEKIYPIYRTEFRKNEKGEWEATETKTGYAESAYYQNPITGSWLLKYPSFNPDSWTEGDLGTGFDDAAYAYIGQTVEAYIGSGETAKYYKITSASAKTVKISAEQSDAIVRVYSNTNGALVNATAGAQGSSTVSFRASKNTTYYVQVSGLAKITFKIT